MLLFLVCLKFHGLPDTYYSNLDKLREFIKYVYVEKKYLLDFCLIPIGPPVGTITINQASKIPCDSLLCYCLLSYDHIDQLYPYAPFLFSIIIWMPNFVPNKAF